MVSLLSPKGSAFDLGEINDHESHLDLGLLAAAHQDGDATSYRVRAAADLERAFDRAAAEERVGMARSLMINHSGMRGGPLALGCDRVVDRV